MSIEIIKDLIKVAEVRGASEVEGLVETEVYLNTNRQEIESILWVEGRTEIISTQVIRDRLLTNGKIKFNLVYKSMEEANNLYTLETTKEFREELEIPGIEEGMEGQVNAQIEYIEYDLEENRIDLRALINLTGQVEETKEIEAIKEIVGGDHLQIKEETIRYKELYGRETSYANIQDELRLDEDNPAIEKVIRFSIEAKEIQTLVAEDRLILSAEALVSFIYQAGNQIGHIQESLPFNHFIELPGVAKDSSASVDLEVVEGIYEIVEDELGELRLIDLDIKIRVDGEVYQHRERPLVVDLYSTKEKLNIQKEDISILENVENLTHVEDLNVDIGIDAEEILDIKEAYIITDKRIQDNSLIIEGILTLDIYYIERFSGEVRNYKDHFPYKSDIYLEEKLDVSEIQIDSKLGDVDYDIGQDILSIDNKINYDIYLNREKTISCIKDIGETSEPIDKSQIPSISIYIVQKGDLLWDVAKRYNTTIEDILSSNNLESSYEIKVGDKIIIEKSLDKDLAAL